MSWLSWIIVGFVAGVLAKLVTGQDRPGCLGTIFVGILGGLLGGAIFTAVGATILLFGWGLVATKRD
jgi:uncharacterized membrane protein YeaQ/YmgE (transglycosylase-associated protein family)